MARRTEKSCPIRCFYYDAKIVQLEFGFRITAHQEKGLTLKASDSDASEHIIEASPGGILIVQNILPHNELSRLCAHTLVEVGNA